MDSPADQVASAPVDEARFWRRYFLTVVIISFVLAAIPVMIIEFLLATGQISRNYEGNHAPLYRSQYDGIFEFCIMGQMMLNCCGLLVNVLAAWRTNGPIPVRILKGLGLSALQWTFLVAMFLLCAWAWD